MTIISVAHKGSESDFAFAVVNDEFVKVALARLTALDVNERFKITAFKADGLTDLEYFIKSEQA